MRCLIEKIIPKQCLSVELRGDDLTHGKKNSMIAYMNYLLGQEKNYSDSREFSLTIRYKFNTTPSKYKGSGAGKGQLNRF